MPVLTVYRHGGKGGVAPMKNSHVRALRGDVSGWSTGAARRNTQFLMSIKEAELSGSGFAVTLTLRDCPPSGDAWHRIRKAWTMRMQRLGMVRLHWVTEWQRRGVPHLHCAIWFAEGCPLEVARFWTVQSWLDLAGQYGAGPRGQFVHPITGPVGWFQYLSKHAARGVAHYQRSAENMPEGWKSRTGRVWGKWGDWPVQAEVRINLQDQHGDGGWFAYRRLCRSWRYADARSAGDAYRIRSARAMLRCSDQGRSRVIGVMEWMPYEVQMAMLGNLGSRGYSVTC
jgi:hypothetical protein